MNKAILILTTILILGVTTNSTFAQDVKVYDTFEEFKEVLERKEDKTYVINFWATWCKPCVKELPYFEELGSNYNAAELEVVLVSLDFKKSIKKSLMPFIQKNNIKSEVVLLADSKTNEWIDMVDEEWSGTIPATLIYDKESYQFIEYEFESYEELNSIIEQFINH